MAQPEPEPEPALPTAEEAVPPEAAARSPEQTTSLLVARAQARTATPSGSPTNTTDASSPGLSPGLSPRARSEVDAAVSSQKAAMMVAKLEELRYLEEAKEAKRIADDYQRQIEAAHEATRQALDRSRVERAARELAEARLRRALLELEAVEGSFSAVLEDSRRSFADAAAR